MNDVLRVLLHVNGFNYKFHIPLPVAVDTGIAYDLTLSGLRNYIDTRQSDVAAQGITDENQYVFEVRACDCVIRL